MITSGENMYHNNEGLYVSTVNLNGKSSNLFDCCCKIGLCHFNSVRFNNVLMTKSRKKIQRILTHHKLKHVARRRYAKKVLMRNRAR
jgi:hypothetical protein